MAHMRRHALADGVTPLQVLMRVMREHLREAESLAVYDREAWELVGVAAARCAPYMHARLVSAQVAVRRPDEMSDDELISSIAVAEAAAASESVCGGVPPGVGETRH